jgi:Xaa-Pro aminopeptidase
VGVKRLERLRQKFKDQNIDAFLVYQVENKQYLSDFKSSSGWLLVLKDIAFLAVDFRYLELAKNQTAQFQIIHVKGSSMDWLFELLAAHNISNVGFEANYIPFSIYQQLCNTISQKNNIHLVATYNLVESLRTIKEQSEIISIATACEIADATVNYARQLIQPGMTEKQVAWELEKFIRDNGSESVPFNFLVASGPNSAMPHAIPTDRKILANEPIIIDLGARSAGYCSDMTRTFFIGGKDKTYSKIYNIVLSAQLATIAMITSGISGESADRLGRDMIKETQYGEAFGHGMGHGIGLEPHEYPRLGPGSADMLSEGMVFTVEPGIYIPGWGGIRIEDTVIIKNNSIVRLTQAEKEPNIQ